MHYPIQSLFGEIYHVGRSLVSLQAWDPAVSRADKLDYGFDLHLKNFRRFSHLIMLLNVDLVSTLSDVSLAMGTNLVVSSFRLAVLAVTLSSSLVGILALPALPLSLNLSPMQVNTSSLLVPPNPRPPQEPTCPSNAQWGTTLGHPSYDDCDYILSSLYPKDPRTKPVMRNFYSAPSDVSHTMPNFRLPYEESYSKQFHADQAT